MALVQSIVNERTDFSFAIANKPGPEPSQEEWDKAFADLDLEIPGPSQRGSEGAVRQGGGGGRE